jgi:hypothetical protein
VSHWSDQIRIGFCADRIIWVRASGVLRRRVVEKLEIEVPASNAQPAWGDALESLKTKLAATVPKQTRTSIVITNRLVRYVVVPWHPALMTQAERLAQARHCFKETYGDMATNWEVAMDDGGYGQPFLASAIDQQLLAGLREACKGLNLQSVQPYLTLAYQQFRKTLRQQKAKVAYFGVVEPNDLGLIRMSKTGLAGVFNQRVGDDWRQTLRGLLLQVATEGDVDPAVCLLASGRDSVDTVASVKVTRLSLPAMLGYSPLSDERMTMGVVGLA